LDVGCASGEIFEYFPNGDWELYGIEPSTVAFERARQRFEAASKIHLINAYLSDVSLEPKSLDVVTMLESLYHMPNPRQELSRVARILKDDGLLAIAMPGYTYQRLRHSGPVSQALYGSRCSLTKSHLFYFSSQSLAALLKTEGFEILDTVQLGSSSYGSSVGQFARQAYLKLSEILGSLTLGKVNLAPHVLYLCEKATRA
jgi:2-polyprenyl-3-methyl-5-hydroxy-6-metoxy-1,4-benzoquinol methylase